MIYEWIASKVTHRRVYVDYRKLIPVERRAHHPDPVPRSVVDGARHPPASVSSAVAVPLDHDVAAPRSPVSILRRATSQVGRRRAGLGAVDDHHQDRRRRRHARADLLARRRRLPTSCAARATRKPRPRAWRRSCPARRCRSSPTSTSSTSSRSRRWKPACRAAPQPRQHPQARAHQGRRHARPRTAACPIRIGVNAGSLDPDIAEQHGGATPEALVASAQRELDLLRRGRLRRREDLGEVVERAADDRRLPPALGDGRLPAAPRRHRGRPAARQGW